MTGPRGPGTRSTLMPVSGAPVSSKPSSQRVEAFQAGCFLAGQRGGHLRRAAPSHGDRGVALGVVRPLVAEPVRVRGQGGVDAQRGEQREDAGQERVPDHVVDQEEVEAVADPEAVEAALDEAQRHRPVRALLDVEHPAALRVGKGPHASLRRQARQGRRRLAGAPEDHEGDGGGERHQRLGGLALRRADKLDGFGPQAGLGEPGSDDQVDQRRGAAQAGAPGAEHAGIAGFDELGGEVDRDIGAGLVVGADHPHGNPPFLQPEPVVEDPAAHDALQRGQRRKGAHLPGDAGEADLVQPEPVDAPGGQGLLGLLQVRLVGGEHRGGLGGEAAGDGAQRLGDLAVGCPGHVAGGAAGLARRLLDEAVDVIAHGWGRIQRLSARLEPSEALVPSTLSVRVPSGPMPVTSTIAPGISFFSSK